MNARSKAQSGAAAQTRAGHQSNACTAAQAWLLPDKQRLHLQHGPIDLIIEAQGRAEEVDLAYQQAVSAFNSVLSTLVEELALLRRQCSSTQSIAKGPVAQRMVLAVEQFAGHFITPMAAVAGAVADHILQCMLRGRTLSRAYVNNGGDIALHLAAGECFKVAVCADPGTGSQGAEIDITHNHRIGGIATSGWRGRSHSLGIADAVTVLAHNSSSADAAATLIANAVDLPGSTLVQRTPASLLTADSDLRNIPVTVAVESLGETDRQQALQSGVRLAREMLASGVISSAYLLVQGESQVVSDGNLQRVTAGNPSLEAMA